MHFKFILKFDSTKELFYIHTYFTVIKIFNSLMLIIRKGENIYCHTNNTNCIVFHIFNFHILPLSHFTYFFNWECYTHYY